MCQDAGIVREFPAFADQRSLLDRIQGDHGSFRQDLDLGFRIPGGTALEKRGALDFFGQEAGQVETIVKGVFLLSDESDAGRGIERTSRLRCGVTSDASADN